MFCFKKSHRILIESTFHTQKRYNEELALASDLMIDGERLRKEIQWRDDEIENLLTYLPDEMGALFRQDIANRRALATVDIEGKTNVVIRKRVNGGKWRPPTDPAPKKEVFEDVAAQRRADGIPDLSDEEIVSINRDPDGDY